MSNWLSPLLILMARSKEDKLRCRNEFLKDENKLLRKRVPLKHIVLENDEREQLLKLGEPREPIGYPATDYESIDQFL